MKFKLCRACCALNFAINIVQQNFYAHHEVRLKSIICISVVRLVSHMTNDEQTCSLKWTALTNAGSLLRLPQFALMKPYEVLIFLNSNEHACTAQHDWESIFMFFGQKLTIAC